MPRSVIPDPVTVENGPDLDGWRAAMQRLIVALGSPVIFRVPQTPVWPPGVELDPETGRPYDPTIDPLSGGDFDEIQVKAGVVFRPIRITRVESQTATEPVGIESTETIALIITETTYLDVKDATRFILNGREFQIQDFVPDGLAGLDRYLVFGNAK